MWALSGVALGAVTTGVISWLLQVKQFAHSKDMWMLEHQSAENVKTILMEMLNHRTHTDRSFDALMKPIGGYSPDQIRQMLHEIGAKRVARPEGGEWWYLTSRETERLANRDRR